MSIKKCPNCDDENIEILYNPKIGKLTLTCYNCHKLYQIQAEKSDLRCPECGNKNIKDEEIELVCGECGLVLAATTEYVAGNKISLIWGLKL